MDILNKLTNALNNYSAQTGVQSATYEMIRDARQEIILLRAQLSKPQPTSQDGFVLVPIEPTEDMIKELMHEWDSVGATSMYENYAAMIQALSPKV